MFLYVPFETSTTPLSHIFSRCHGKSYFQMAKVAISRPLCSFAKAFRRIKKAEALDTSANPLRRSSPRHSTRSLTRFRTLRSCPEGAFPNIPRFREGALVPLLSEGRSRQRPPGCAELVSSSADFPRAL